MLLHLFTSTLMGILGLIIFCSWRKIKKLDNALFLKSVKLRSKINTIYKRLSIMIFFLWCFTVYFIFRIIFNMNGASIGILTYCISVPLAAVIINFFCLHFRESIILTIVIGSGYLSYLLAAL